MKRYFDMKGVENRTVLELRVERYPADEIDDTR